MSTRRRNRRWIRASGRARWGVLAAVPLVFVAAPSLGQLPARLIRGCPTWIVLAGTLEVLSILGFVVSFALVFCGPMSRRQSIVAGLRALGASTVLPGGGLIGPAIGARSAMPDPSAPLRLVRSTIAFTILTTAPGAIALAVFGVSLWLGWPGGPHEALLTLPAAAVSVAALALLCWLARPSAAPTAPPGPPRRGALGWVADSSRVPRAGAAEARRLLGARDWKLLGPLAYYACDNAVLWAAFHAYGYSAALGAIVMGYLIGSLGGALPVPGGFGAAEGGLVGALVLYGAPVGPAASAVLLYRGISLGLSVSLGGGAWALANGRRRDQ